MRPGTRCSTASIDCARRRRWCGSRCPSGEFEPFWLVTRYDDVMRISKDNTGFLNAPRPDRLTNKRGEALARQITGGSANLVNSLVAMDAPIHPKMRRLTQDWFMPKSLAKIEADIRDLARSTVSRLVEAGEGGPGGTGNVDFVKEVSAPYPLHVVMQILGVPEEDEPRMLFLTQQIFGGQDEDLNKSGIADLSPEQITQIVLGAIADFERYFDELAKERRAEPTEDVASLLANATLDGEPLSPRDLAGYYIILAAAGHDTTSASTAGAMQALSRDPEQFARVKADRSLLPGIVEEAIRWTTPVQHFMRMAAQDTEIAGVPVREGEWLMINYVAANHDPAQFEHPRKFDAARSPNRHLAFGAGRTSVWVSTSPGWRCASSSKRCSTAWTASNRRERRSERARPSLVGSRPCRCGSARADLIGNSPCRHALSVHGRVEQCGRSVGE
jgi:cytochrome P450